jgi:hypothetical protein
VRAQLAGVRGDPLHADRLVGRLHRLDVADERHLGVDDHLPAVGEGDHEVGSHARALVAPAGGLLDEVAVLEQAGDLHDPAQLHLAPPAADVRRAQRRHQRRRLLPQEARGLVDGAHLLAQLAMGGGPRPLHAGEQPVQVVERLVHRLQSAVTGPAPAEQRDGAERRGGGQQRAEEEPGEQGSGVHGRQGAGRCRQFPRCSCSASA